MGGFATRGWRNPPHPVTTPPTRVVSKTSPVVRSGRCGVYLGVSGQATVDEAVFASFVQEAEPRLRRALVALRGPEDGRDATAEALAWAWQNWDRVTQMDNPIGYLFRVGQSRSRARRHGHLPVTDLHGHMPYVEPGLGPALAALSQTQRTVVVLVHGCDFTYTEVAAALAISKSSVGTHLKRAMDRLRSALDVTEEDHDA
jgi:DNA-directed RNA polymerase specialized sigma24 family protein